MADNSHSYPNGIFGPLNGPPDPAALNEQEKAGNDPSFLSAQYLMMSEAWQPILICEAGTQGLRENASTLLPLEPREDVDSWRRRVAHATLSPFLTRIAEQAAGLIMRKPITLQPREDGQQVDEWWELFAKDVDGYGTELDSFARQVVLHSLLFGHSAICVDYPSTEAANNLREERELGLRPFFLEIKATQVLGWRKEADTPLAKINQIRISEYVEENFGNFGTKVIHQIRILEQGSWSLWRKGEDGWALHQEGTTSLPYIPLAVTYSGKLGELISKPPLLPIAHLNLQHAVRSCDLFHSLHVASQPIMYLKGFSDDGDDQIGLSANTAILLPETGDVGYAEPASSAFEAQQNYITELENQCRNLGISTLFNQTYVGETAEAKSMDRSDSDSMLSVVAQDLERCLQNAFDMVGDYVGREAPLVTVSRDFNLQELSHNQISQYLSLWVQGAISHNTLLEMLVRGECLPDVDVEKEIELIESTKLMDLDASAAGGVFAEDEESESVSVEEEESEVRKEVVRRMRKLAEEDEEDEN